MLRNLEYYEQIYYGGQVAGRGLQSPSELRRAFDMMSREYAEAVGGFLPADRNAAWLDMGTHESLHRAAVYVESIQAIQGYQVANLEEIALRKGWITAEELRRNIARQGQSSYSRYLQEILADHGHKNPNLCAD